MGRDNKKRKKPNKEWVKWVYGGSPRPSQKKGDKSEAKDRR